MERDSALGWVTARAETLHGSSSVNCEPIFTFFAWVESIRRDLSETSAEHIDSMKFSVKDLFEDQHFRTFELRLGWVRLG
jgi:hypothetical protein